MTIDTQRLRELAQKATPGPWNCELDRGSYLRIYSETNSAIVDGCGCCGSPNCDEADAKFIIAVNPATVLALLDNHAKIERDLSAACYELAAMYRLLDLNPATASATAISAIARLKKIEAAARNLVKVKGRHNSEIAMNQLLETLE